MNIETVFNLDDEVFFILNNRLQRGTVTYVSASVSKFQGHTLYTISYNDALEDGRLKGVEINESYVFKDREKVFDFLIFEFEHRPVRIDK